MASPFWIYFSDKLHWPQAFAPGPLQALVRGLAHHLDTTREDMPYLRQQFFPDLCEDALVPEHGLSRSLVRHPRETPERFRQRVVHAYRWHMLGGKMLGLPEILKFYGFPVAQLDNLGEYSRARWAEFDLKLDSPDSVDAYNALLTDVGQLIWLVNEYKPARSVLSRIYTDIHDRRPLVLSLGPVLGDGYLSYFSGVAALEFGTSGDTQLSFGFRFPSFSPAHAHAGLMGWHERHALLARRLKCFIVGLSRLSAVYEQKKPFVFGGLVSLLEERERLRRGFGVARRAKAQAVLSEAWDLLGGSNFRLGTAWRTLPSTPFSVGLSALSGTDGRSRRIRLDEMLAERAGFTAARAERPESVGFSWDATDHFAARRMTRIILGLSRLSEVYPSNKTYFFSERLTVPARHERPPIGFGAARRAKAQAVFSEAWDALGGSNFRLGTA